MAVKRELWLIFILVIVIAILISFISFFNINVEQADAKKFVQEDLRTKFPNADTEILSITEKKDEKDQKYFEVKARVTKYPNSACPERLHTYYNYPKQNFVNPPDEIITKNCVVCADPDKQCVLAFPEEAVIASHTFKGTEQVDNYIKGEASATPTVKQVSNSWIIIWGSDVASSFYEIEIARNGTLISVNKKAKEI